MKFFKLLLLFILMLFYFYLSDKVKISSGIEFNIFSIDYGNIFINLIIFTLIIIILPTIFRKKTYFVIIAGLIIMNIFLMIKLLFLS